ncbi:MAG: hypothetical protein VZQ80_09605, partial [Lachnospiraceae bacterium]|nr:hypothetical protein [Lachnospiraceae bacterium]
KVFSEQIKEKGRTREAVEAAIRICVDRNVLREYLKQHEGEVITMMMSLFDQDEVTKISLAAQRKEDILGVISILRSMGLQDREIAEKVREQYGLTEEEADKLLAVKA